MQEQPSRAHTPARGTGVRPRWKRAIQPRNCQRSRARTTQTVVKTVPQEPRGAENPRLSHTGRRCSDPLTDPGNLAKTWSPRWGGTARPRASRNAAMVWNLNNEKPFFASLHEVWLFWGVHAKGCLAQRRDGATVWNRKEQAFAASLRETSCGSHLFGSGYAGIGMDRPRWRHRPMRVFLAGVCSLWPESC